VVHSRGRYGSISAAIGVAISLAIMLFAFRGKGHPKPPE